MNRRHALTCLTTLAAAAALAGCQDRPAAGASGTSGTPGTPGAAPAAAPPATTDPYARAAEGHGFVVGPMMAAHTVYVFFDATCPHCAQLWKNSEPLRGQLKMVWVPVALRPATAVLGAGILGAADPLAAMQANEARVLAGQPPVPPSPLPDEAVLDKVRVNTDLFQRLGADSVPFIVFRRPDGSGATRAGVVGPDELKAMLGM